MRNAFRPLALLLLAALPGSLRGQRADAARDRTPLLELGRGEVIACTRVTSLSAQHRADGVAVAYTLRFPQTRRDGEVGIAASGATRTLRISFDERSSVAHERYSAVLRFAANGRVEVGELRYDVLRSRDSENASNYVLIPSADHEQALALARLIAAQCHPPKP